MNVSRFGVTELDDLPEDLRERVGVIPEKSGFVPNIFRALGHRPRELRAFLDYHDALMEGTDGLSKAERELVVVATSGANHCTYCVVAHGAILRIRSKDPQLADRVAVNPWQAELDQRSRAIVDLALALTRGPSVRRGRPGPGPRGRPDRGRDLGRRGDHRAVRGVQPARPPDRAAAERRVLRDGPLTALTVRARPHCPIHDFHHRNAYNGHLRWVRLGCPAPGGSARFLAARGELLDHGQPSDRSAASPGHDRRRADRA